MLLLFFKGTKIDKSVMLCKLFFPLFIFPLSWIFFLTCKQIYLLLLAFPFLGAVMFFLPFTVFFLEPCCAISSIHFS